VSTGGKTLAHGSRQLSLSMIDQRRLPKGLKPLEYLPSVDGRKAVCVWEAVSLNALRQFIDRETADAARNDYFEVNVANAVGLPKREEATMARAA
jgi:DNA polymerase/3'-5' exonuclease PolX